MWTLRDWEAFAPVRAFMAWSTNTPAGAMQLKGLLCRVYPSHATHPSHVKGTALQSTKPTLESARKFAASCSRPVRTLKTANSKNATSVATTEKKKKKKKKKKLTINSSAQHPRIPGWASYRSFYDLLARPCEQPHVMCLHRLSKLITNHAVNLAV